MAWRPNYVTDAAAAEIILQAVGAEEDDQWIGLVVTAASRAADRHCGRQFGLIDTPAPMVCDLTYRSERDRWVAQIPDLMTTVGLTIDVAGGAVTTGYRLGPADAALDGKPWTRLELPYGDRYTWTTTPEATITGRWGWSTQPGPVAPAVMLQLQRFYMRRGSPFGVAGSPDLGSELRLLSKVDPDVAVMLADLVRPRVAA